MFRLLLPRDRYGDGRVAGAELPASYGPATGTPEQGIDDTFIFYAGPRTEN